MLQQRALWLPRGEREKDLKTSLRLGFELRARYLIGGKLLSSQKESASNFVLLGGSILCCCCSWSFLLVLQKRVSRGFWLFGLLGLFKRRRRRRKKEEGWCFFCCRSKQNWRMSLILKPREAPMAVNSPSFSRLLFFFASFQPFPTSKKCISRVSKKLFWRLSSPHVSKNLNLWKLSSSLHTSIIYLWRKTSRNHPSFKEWERFLHDCRLWEELCNQESFRRCLDMGGVSIRAEGKRDMSLHMCVCLTLSLCLCVQLLLLLLIVCMPKCSRLNAGVAAV